MYSREYLCISYVYLTLYVCFYFSAGVRHIVPDIVAMQGLILYMYIGVSR